MGFQALNKNQEMDINGGSIVVIATGVAMVVAAYTACQVVQYA